MDAKELSEVFYKSFFTGKMETSLFEYLELFTSDEIGEIDLENDHYTPVFRVGGKYQAPVSDGSYNKLYCFVRDNIIHPDDLAAYIDLMDPETIMEKLHESETRNFRFDQFRIRTQDGSYRYIEHCVLTGEENHIAPGKIRFYIFDIHNMKGKELGRDVEDSQLSDFFRDPMTGLWNESSYFKNAGELVYKEKETTFQVIAIDIDHFKLFDEWYGRETGNLLLGKIGHILFEAEKKYSGVAGYLGQDDFVFTAKLNQKQINSLYNKIKDCVITSGYSIGFMPTFGIADFDSNISLGQAYDRASIAAYRAKGITGCHIYRYEPTIHTQVEDEYKILSDFMTAMKNEEIEFFLQPQCRISNENIVGVESLCRWRKPNGEFISPAIFIPVLEKYGFITDLDKYIWEKVCASLKNWLNRGKRAVPCSVNISQVDLFTLDIPSHFEGLIKKYGIPVDLLKLEITESAYAENPELVNGIVDRLHEIGFTVLMDDFGSGYSSLNMLSTLNVDVIKLDGLFLKFRDKEYKKSVRILESIVNMAKQLAIPVIVEGVETEEQAKFLIELGIRYVQGFHFYRPMSRLDFEQLIDNGARIDDRGFIVKLNEQFQTREFLDETVYSDSMLNNILGPVAIYLLKDKHVDIIRFNEQFYETVDEVDFQGRLHAIENFIPKFNRADLFRLLREAAENKVNGSKGVLRFFKTDGTLTTYVMRFYYLGEQEGGQRFYGAATNMSEFAKLQNQMKLIVDFSSDTVIFMKFDKSCPNGMSFTVTAHGLANDLGISKEELEKELNDSSFYDRIGEEKTREIVGIFNKATGKKKPYTFDFDVKTDDGRIVPIRAKGDPVYDPITDTSYIINFRHK